MIRYSDRTRHLVLGALMRGKPWQWCADAASIDVRTVRAIALAAGYPHRSRMLAVRDEVALRLGRPADRETEVITQQLAAAARSAEEATRLLGARAAELLADIEMRLQLEAAGGRYDADLVRAWARAQGMHCTDHGPIPTQVATAWREHVAATGGS